MPPTAQPAPHTMRCLEVWGGNQAVNNGVVMAGLDAWLYSRPFRDQPAGGDIHYVSSCAAGMVTRVLVADVSGHGEPVAEAARKLRLLMRRYVNFVDQARFVEGLNTEFAALAHTGGFATAVAATYLALTDDFTVCNAGHPRPLWYRARTREWSLMAGEGAADSAGPTNVPLGIAEPTRYQQFVVRVATGDLVVLYTDSLIEAKDAQGRMLGQDGLLRAARGLDPTDPGEFMHALLEAVAHHASGDDLTVLILRPNGLKPRLSMVVQLKALVRMVGAVFASVGRSEFPAYEAGLWARVGALLNRNRSRP